MNKVVQYSSLCASIENLNSVQHNYVCPKKTRCSAMQCAVRIRISLFRII